ncbi:unnamed protein product [Cyprideis torosa]|uniref:Uncharacterized protein n=1 Tax=Cyprideis torosa TaxID=163714 RepID=A0A7R8ZGX9_9CRUS|nr:unnamed protein product [Cyprideis torosa]CAG0881308.1 unnamed protein product [Cyprideis torosa]
MVNEIRDDWVAVDEDVLVAEELDEDERFNLVNEIRERNEQSEDSGEDESDEKDAPEELTPSAAEMRHFFHRLEGPRPPRPKRRRTSTTPANVQDGSLPLPLGPLSSNDLMREVTARAGRPSVGHQRSRSDFRGHPSSGRSSSTDSATSSTSNSTSSSTTGRNANRDQKSRTMSSAEEFNLRWNNHLNTISQLLGEFLNNKSLCDVTLSAEGQTISCHRVILAACSTYFQGIFNQVNDKALVVMVKDAKFIDLKSLVDFMYYGEVSVEHDRLNSLLRTAESLKVKGLADEKKKEERILSEPPMPVNVPQPAAVPQKRVMPPMDSMAKRQRVSAPAFAHSPRPSSASIPSPRVEGGVSQDGVQPKQELVDLEGDENDTGDQQSYLEGDDDSNLSGAGPSSSGMEGLDESGQMEGVEGQDDLRV